VVASLPTFASHILPKVISVFARSHPLVGIQVYDETQSSLIRRVQNQEAEFGIGARPDSLDGLRFAPIFSDPLVAVLPKDHPLASRSTLDMKTLAKTTLVTLSASAHIRTLTDRAFRDIGIVPNFAFEAFDRHTVCGMVDAGLGATILPRLVLSTIGNNALRAVRPIKPRVAREFGVIERRDQAQSPAVKSFLAVLVSTLKRNRF
jgi:LysR family carnitine catabolism transcriptional activator